MGNKEQYRIKKTKLGIKSWCLEPLPIATLNGITPKKWKRKFFDDRIEDIDYNTDCDLVAITVETFTAKRAYEISTKFRKIGKKVILGGFHPSLLPEEAIQHADSILIGEAEGIWDKILDDSEKKRLKRIYKANGRADLSLVNVNRGIYNDKKYFPFTLIESGRGCIFNCDFCCVTLFFKRRYIRRPIEKIIEEVKKVKNKKILFVDDNICSDIKSAKILFKALIPLNIKWASSASVNIVNDDELLDLMKASGCLGVLLGLESISEKNLKQMNKKQSKDDINRLIKKMHKSGIGIYGSFVIGYDYDDEKTVMETVNFAIEKKLLLANFYQLTPLPGTRLYRRLEKEKRLLYDKWWLEPDYSYGEVTYEPKSITSKELSGLCNKARNKFYSWSSLISRFFNPKTTFNHPYAPVFYFLANLLTRTEIKKKQWRRLGRNNEL